MKRRDEFEEVKAAILARLESGRCGLFYTRNIVGDKMTTVIDGDGLNSIKLDICYPWAYFEVFGLSEDEEEELEAWYCEQVTELKRRLYNV